MKIIIIAVCWEGAVDKWLLFRAQWNFNSEKSGIKINYFIAVPLMRLECPLDQDTRWQQNVCNSKYGRGS